MNLTRRLVLAAAGMAPVLHLSPVRAKASMAQLERLRRMVPLPGSARAIGRLYRAVHAEDAAAAAALIAASLPSGAWEGGDAELRAALRGQVRSDFRDGRTVVVADYLLSRTEARLAALWA